MEAVAKRILVVDDDPDIRMLIRMALSAAGYEVIEASDGQEAFWLAEQGPRPDAIVLDLMMPRMDGWQTLDALKADAGLRYVPVLVVSAAPERDTDRARRHAQAVIRKPFSVDVLLEALEKALAGR
jgi:CheY-like chemotaxis protein